MDRNPPDTRYYAELPDEFKTSSWGEICDAGRPASKARAEFVTTDWHLVKSGSRGEMRSLDAMARAYWYPLKSYARRRLRSEEDAEDAVQSFMLRLMDPLWLLKANPSKGKFRAFMLTSFKHLLIDMIRKRNPDRLVALEELATEGMPDENAISPDAEFESSFYQDWGNTLLDLALQRLEERQIALGKGALFAEFKPHLSQRENFAGLAERVGMPAGTVRVCLHRLEKQLKRITRDEVKRTLDNPTEEEVDAELEFLRKHLQARTARVDAD